MAVSSHVYFIRSLNSGEITFLENWLDDVHVSVHQPDNITLKGENDEAESDAASIRDVLAQFFLTAEGRYMSYGRE